VSCDFSVITLPSLPAAADSKPSIPRRGRPRSDWASWAEQIRLSSTAATAATPEPDTVLLNVDDIEIYHNWITKAAATIVERGSDAGLWLDGAPQLGFGQPCILDLILAFSAYHLARYRPEEAVKYNLLADQHCTAALKAATALLRQFNPADSSVLYMTSVLVCFTALAQGPKPGHLLLVADFGQVPWLALLRGVRLVIRSVGWSSIFSGPISRYFPSEKAEEQSAEQPSMPGDAEVGAEDWRLSLKKLEDVVDLCAEEEMRKHYKNDLQVLTGCYESTFGKGSHARPVTEGKMQVVMAWIYQLDESLVEGLHRRESVALILLGHFCVLLDTLKGFWFMEGWAQHIMTEILKVSETSRKWLTWPIQFLEGHER
jgi:hypothetical protein